MLLNISCMGPDATDLSWLLHKRPDRLQKFDLPFGQAFVFFPEYSQAKSSVCLILETDHEGLNELYKNRDGEFQFVNPRQFISSSLLSTAMSRIFSSALRGQCPEKPELIQKNFDFEVEIINFSCRFSSDRLESILAPLGYTYKLSGMDQKFSAFLPHLANLNLAAHGTLQKLLSQLFILIPVLDRHIHYWIDEEQLQKFIRFSQGWLENHPEKRLIINEYFRSAPELKYKALEIFTALLSLGEKEKAPSLNELRQKAIESILVRNGIKSLIDLGCGEGSLLARLKESKSYTRLAGMDVSAKNVERARKKLLSPGIDPNYGLEIFPGSLTCRDKRLSGFDAAILSEVLEHFEPERMDLVMRNILGEARPDLLIVSTPNKTYNSQFPFLEEGELRHPDHRYEFTENEFIKFCQNYAAAFGYEFESSRVGEIQPSVGAPSLLGVFKKCA